ncbi:diacylglycerol kinase alpha, putative [Babesia ovis]|uniref:Diacylglycerol kinase alpha, putative n=1 Tax=Babesia ovis TaxID=5869 RepID=A0A9W5WVT2_BABOV|nr:diacylglycerol kinase alpha, putative [Babesia ovis]
MVGSGPVFFTLFSLGFPVKPSIADARVLHPTSLVTSTLGNERTTSRLASPTLDSLSYSLTARCKVRPLSERADSTTPFLGECVAFDKEYCTRCSMTMNSFMVNLPSASASAISHILTSSSSCSSLRMR